ncbi:MAG TPA: hypothetical protein VGX78_19545, partial [Pirellulales bacterium]|nr:hypothetical protein [Pirellulales bacterium]
NRIVPLFGVAGVGGMLLCWLAGRCFGMANKKRQRDLIANDVVGAILLAAGLLLMAVSIVTAIFSQ